MTSRSMQAALLFALFAVLAVAGCDEPSPPAPPPEEPAPPTAAFEADIDSGYAPLSVVFTNTSEGEYTKAVWDFGDGCQSLHPNPCHIFLLPGSFTVSLYLYREEEIVASKTMENLITVLDPSVLPCAAFSSSPATVLVGSPVQFTDQSTGDVDAWFWNFGDGSASVLTNPEHRYLATGSYDVALTVSGSHGTDTLTRTACVVVVAAFPPVASFTSGTTSGPSPLTVNFTDTSTGSVSSWLWNFGDGTTSASQNPTRVYTGSVGSVFTVSLTVTGPGGSDTETRTSYISITSGAPSADFTSDVQSGLTPLTVHFQDLSTGSITSWFWDFGDGSTSTAQNPAHTYVTAAYFTVSLTVSGPGGTDTERKPGFITTGSTPWPCVPVIYLYPERPRVEDVKVFLEGTATVTIPSVPLGRTVVWREVETGFADGGVVWEGQRYPYLFYEAVLDVPVFSHSGWILERDGAGVLRLNGEEISFDGLRAHFESELAEAGLFAREIRDFVDCWLGSDRALFFGRETFRYAIRYFPADQLEKAMRLVTTWKYHSVVRVQFTVDHAPEGLELFEPVYAPAPRTGSVLHEWGVVPTSCVLEGE